VNDELPDARSGFSRSDASPNPAALDAAMAAVGSNGEEAREFLRQQMRLTQLQARVLEEAHALELSHLKWRRFMERVRGTGHVMLVLAGFVLLAALAAAVWSAANDRGLVVESFSVPPELSKFEEADKYAPRWGRLHLEWGEALLYTGDKAGVRKQFEAASHLDLSKADSAMLARMRPAHG
jgi:hypothetical protein